MVCAKLTIFRPFSQDFVVRRSGEDGYTMYLNDRGKVATYEIGLHRPPLGVRFGLNMRM